VDEDGYIDSDDIDMYAIRYERMDEHAPNSHGWYPTDQRYEVSKSSGVESPHLWGRK
jgi:hypothetical protein